MGLSSSSPPTGAGDSSFVGARISSTPDSLNQFARNMTQNTDGNFGFLCGEESEGFVFPICKRCHENR